MQLIPSVNLN